jgi:cytochrome c oxidase cbb3-type subunit 1
MNYTFETLVMAVLAFAALLGVAFTQDSLFAAHMWVAFFVLTAGTIVMLRRMQFAPSTASSSAQAAKAPQSEYFDDVVRYGVIATVFWGVGGHAGGRGRGPAAGLSPISISSPWTQFRAPAAAAHLGVSSLPSAATALIATSLLCRPAHLARPAPPGDNLAWFVFWGYQFFIVMAATGYLLGITQGKEYAEPEWYVDLWLTIVWVAYLITVPRHDHDKRRNPTSTWPTGSTSPSSSPIAMLHIVNNLAVPVSFLGVKSYSAFAGVQDALTQWWYGHNAVGFFLTAGFLGMMYYFVPKQAERPVYSYRLSIIHFWALIFLYIWAGPHHLHYTALPDWAQTLGMVFSIMLWMPSWGGMINGLMTLSGAWDKIRTDPIIRMMVIAIAFYGMSTFEGPMMSIKAVNSLSHYTEWTIGHVHSGALGWVGMISFGAIYYLTPKLWNRNRLYSLRLVNWHFWLATLGIVVYAAVHVGCRYQQGLMWREYDAQGFLVYSFAETVAAHVPLLRARAVGGAMYLARQL